MKLLEHLLSFSHDELSEKLKNERCLLGESWYIDTLLLWI